MKTFTFRHRRIKNFRLSQPFTLSKQEGRKERLKAAPAWEFKNFLLSVKGEEEREKFLATMEQMPRRIQNDIVEVDAEAMARLESDPFRRRRQRVVRGPQGTRDIESTAKGTASPRPTVDSLYPEGGRNKVDIAMPGLVPPNAPGAGTTTIEQADESQGNDARGNVNAAAEAGRQAALAATNQAKMLDQGKPSPDLPDSNRPAPVPGRNAADDLAALLKQSPNRQNPAMVPSPTSAPSQE